MYLIKPKKRFIRYIFSPPLPHANPYAFSFSSKNTAILLFFTLNTFLQNSLPHIILLYFHKSFIPSITLKLFLTTSTSPPRLPIFTIRLNSSPASCTPILNNSPLPNIFSQNLPLISSYFYHTIPNQLKTPKTYLSYFFINFSYFITFISYLFICYGYFFILFHLFIKHS